MSYSYAAERPWLFTEDGQVAFLNVRDQVKTLLDKSGAFRADKISMTGDSFHVIACIDRLVELKEIVPLRVNCWGQYQVYATPQIHNY